MLKRLCFAIVLAFPFFNASADDASPAPAISLSSGTLTATGVSRGGEVIWFGRGVVYRGGVAHRLRFLQVVRDDDRDGSVTYTPSSVPDFSTWAVVDFESGNAVLWTPPTYTLRSVALPAGVWRGGISRIDISRDYIDVLFVRPRHGAWSLPIWQGGGNDDDGVNDSILRAALRTMKPFIGDRQPPPTATPGDVIVIIDPRELDVFAHKAD